MPTPLRSRVAALPLLLALGCTIEPGADETVPTDGSLGSTCDDDAPCDDELVCPAGGHLAGHCAAACDVDADCRIVAGDSFYCLDGVCTRVCADTCALGANTARCASSERCVSQSLLTPGATDCLAWCVP